MIPPTWIVSLESDGGIPFASRANRKLFTAKVLSPGGTSYAAVSQKILKGAAARIFLYWLSGVLFECTDDSLHQRCLSGKMPVLM